MIKSRLAVCLALLGIVGPVFPQNRPAPDAFDAGIAPFLKKHCWSCHGPDKQKAQLRLDRLEGFRAGDRHLWTKVHEQIVEGRMPPEERSRPAAAEQQQILSWIEKEQKAVSYTHLTLPTILRV